MKEIFGAIPIDHLTTSQLLAKKQNRLNLIIFGLVSAVGVGIYIGYTLRGNATEVSDKSNITDNGPKFTNFSKTNFRKNTVSDFARRIEL